MSKFWPILICRLTKFRPYQPFMIATVTTQHPNGMSSRSTIHYMRDSNLASAPLLVPRRTARSHTLPASSHSSRQLSSSPCSLPGWDDSDSDSSTCGTPASCKTTIQLRRGRAKGLRSSFSNNASVPLSPSGASATLVGQICYPDTKPGRSEVTIAAPRPLMYSPGTLRLSVETIRSHMFLHSTRPDPRSNSGNGSKSAPPPYSNRVEAPLIIRKKSGQPVKSSLKNSRSSTRGNLSIVTLGSSSKSEPSTPKAVHFDAKLEHVKLFLAEQKPLAVSRDGSPTDDTSGTDSDFPSYIYGEHDPMRQSRKKLVMRPINTPSRPNLEADVVLEDFDLNSDSTSILGKVRVRNLAFAKFVTVRFTFDSWQTTSEVTGQYAESINTHFDRFSFSIRLNDLLARIEGKTLVMAIRYNVAGKELWDNNDQQNYVATFTKAKVTSESRKSDDEDASDVDNLRSRLEQVILEDKKSSVSARPLKNFAMSRSEETDPPSFQSNIPFSSRYDFTTSLRNPTTWKPSDVSTWRFPLKDAPILSQSVRNATLPLPPSSIPFPEKVSLTKRPAALPASAPPPEERPLGSPRDTEQAPLLVPPRVRPKDSTDGTLSSDAVQCRNHRRGCSDTGSLIVNSSVKITPPSSASSKPQELTSVSMPSALPRYHSFPPLLPNGNSRSSPSQYSIGFESPRSTTTRQSPPTNPPSGVVQGCGPTLGESSGESELSTSGLTTPTSSRSPTPSPTTSFKKGVALPPLESDAFDLNSGLGRAKHLPPVGPGTPYRQFLNKYVFKAHF